MRFNDFAEKVQAHGYMWNLEQFHSAGMQVSNTIGQTTVRSTGVLLAVTRVIARPLIDDGPPRTAWHISTANTVSTNEEFDRKNVIPIDFSETDELIRVPAGHSPWLPDNTQVIVSSERVFFPSLYLPNDGFDDAERYPLVIPTDAPADL